MYSGTFKKNVSVISLSKWCKSAENQGEYFDALNMLTHARG